MICLHELNERYIRGEISRDAFYQQALALHNSLLDYTKQLSGGLVSQIILAAEGLHLKLHNGLLLEWHPDDLKGAANVLVNEKVYEGYLARLLSALGEKVSVFLDVGANMGYYSLVIGGDYSTKNASGKVYAFEPIPRTFDLLCRNVSSNHLNSTIECLNLCVGAGQGRQTMFLPSSRPTAASLKDLHPGTDTIAVEVDVVDLDSFVERRSIAKVGLIKVDVEGAEAFVVEGAVNMIQRDRPFMVLELLRKWAAKFDYHPNQVLEKMHGFGYVTYAIGQTSLRPICSVDEDTAETNFLFVPREQVECVLALAI